MSTMLSATPMTFVPTKLAVAKMMGFDKLRKKLNLYLSILLVTLCFVLSFTIANIQVAIALVTATIGPLIGFILPIIFYLKTKRKSIR
jgi:hypothetical protein